MRPSANHVKKQSSHQRFARIEVAGIASPSSHSSFCEEVFPVAATALSRHAVKRPDIAGRLHRMRWTGQIFWLLAFEDSLHLLPAFTPEITSRIGPLGSCIQLQQRNCSRFSRDFLRRSTFPSSQRTGTRTTDLRYKRQDYLINRQACCHVGIVGRFCETPRNGV